MICSDKFLNSYSEIHVNWNEGFYICLHTLRAFGACRHIDASLHELESKLWAKICHRWSMPVEKKTKTDDKPVEISKLKIHKVRHRLK